MLKFLGTFRYFEDELGFKHYLRLRTEMAPAKPRELTITVLGAGGVGKSCVTIRYVRNKFIPDYDPTVEDIYRKQVNLDGTAYHVEILGTAGQDDFSFTREQVRPFKDFLVFLYSLKRVAHCHGTSSSGCVLHRVHAQF